MIELGTMFPSQNSFSAVVLSIFCVFEGWNPLLGTFLRSKSAGGCPMGPQGDFFMIFRGFWSPFGRLVGLGFRTFRTCFGDRISGGSQSRFFIDVGMILEAFCRYFGDCFWTSGFSGFCDPSQAKPLFLRSAGMLFSHFFETIWEDCFQTSLFDDF